MNTIEEIRERYRFTRFAYEGDDPPQAQKDIDFLLSEVERLKEENDRLRHHSEWQASYGDIHPGDVR